MPRKATNPEVATRIKVTAELCSLGYRQSDIKRLLKDQYGIEWRQANRYIRLARERLLRETQKPREEHQGDLLEFYRGKLRSPDLKIAMDAAKGIVDLLGLAESKRMHHKVEGEIVHTVLDLVKDPAVQERVRSLTNTNGNQ